jgi:hypothetical protein
MRGRIFGNEIEGSVRQEARTRLTTADPWMRSERPVRAAS